MPTKNFVSIIIPALNEERYIGMCLSAIRDLDFDKKSYEVILSDNGSTDRTREIAESFKDSLNLRIIVCPGVKVAELRNSGVRESHGDILAFVDADCTVHKDWLNNSVQYFSDQSIAVVGYGHEIPPDNTWVERAWDLNKKRKLGPTKTLPSGNMIVRRTSFVEVGGFDASLTTNEDFDLCYKLREKGYVIFASPEIRVVHWGFPKDLATFYRRELWHGTNVLRVFFGDIRKLRNVKSALFALYNILALLFLLAGIILYVASGLRVFLVAAVCALLAPPFILTLRTLKGRPFSYGQFAQLYVLYFIYGIARAISVFQFK